MEPNVVNKTLQSILGIGYGLFGLWGMLGLGKDPLKVAMESEIKEGEAALRHVEHWRTIRESAERVRDRTDGASLSASEVTVLVYRELEHAFEAKARTHEQHADALGREIDKNAKALEAKTKVNQETLRTELDAKLEAEKDLVVARLKAQVQERETVIAELRAKVDELRRVIDGTSVRLSNVLAGVPEEYREEVAKDLGGGPPDEESPDAPDDDDGPVSDDSSDPDGASGEY